MTTLLLIYVMLANEHIPPEYPKFFSVYRTEQACIEAATKYMTINGKVNFLLNARCVDARNPKLVPLLRDVTEIEAIHIKETPIEYK